MNNVYVLYVMFACAIDMIPFGIGSREIAEDKPCPSAADPLGVHRVDCFPEGGANKVTCRARGCCYDDSIPEDSRVPACFFPKHYGYYTDQQPRKEGNTWSGILHRYDTPSLYGGDIDTLAVLVEEQTNNRLRIKLYDPAVARAEVPFTKIQNPGIEPQHTLYRVEFSLNPFNVRVVRKRTDQIIFDSSMGGMVFSDQYLQLSTRLASPHVYGLGEHVHTNGVKHDMDWRTWAIHAAGKHPTGPEAMNLYGSHPVYMNIEYDGHANMVLLLNQHAMDVVLQPAPAVTFRTIGGILDFYIFLSDDVVRQEKRECDSEECASAAQRNTPPVQVIENYLQAIGKPMMPPYWALGHQLCRWNYGGSRGLHDVIKRNREAGIPYDVQWSDIDYMNNAQSFTIDEDNFPDLSDIVRDLHKHEQKYIAICDPGIKTDPEGQNEVYDDGCRRDVWIKQADGGPLDGEVWPGVCKFPDFTKEQTKEWWKRQATMFHDKLAFDGFWIDMNEPTTFLYDWTPDCGDNKWDNPPYTPKITGGNLWNRTLCMESMQSMGRHYDLHSLYGHSMINATQYAGEAIFGNQRFLIVSRSTFVGSGQSAGKWLGDNKSSFLDMKWSITGMIEMNMFGLPYVGADICGFFLDTEEQLCQRWYQLGAFYPMSRNHNINDTMAQDPASFSEQFIKSTRSVLLTRYRLLPYLYTLFHLAHTQGSPVIRPLAFEFPLDNTALPIDRQFLWGSALLISPVLTNNTVTVKAYFPRARWFNFFTGGEVKTTGQRLSLSAPLDQINLHVRGGHVIPLQEPAITTYHSRRNPMSLLVVYDEHQEAEGLLYWDDGETKNSHARKLCRIVRFFASEDMLVVTTRHSEGHLIPPIKIDSITFYGLTAVDADFIVLKSTKAATIEKLEQIEWDPNKQVLRVTGLALDLTDNHVISWTSSR